MKHARRPKFPAHPVALAALLAAALVGVVPAAQARNVRLMESVPDTIRTSRVHDILGSLDLRFGSDTARGASVVRRDVVVKGVGATKLDDVDESRARPSDRGLCARAFEDAITQLAFAARGAGATAIVGVISNYDGAVFDDPVHYECHVGALKAAVTLRAQLATRASVPVLSPPPPPVPAATPPAALPATPEPDVAPPPAATFQPLPPRPASTPN